MSQKVTIRGDESKVSTGKTGKELAFLYDLFIAPDWGDRFAELLDEHVILPPEGKALYLAAGTGGHAMAMQERAEQKLTFLCVDENDEFLELARLKATTTNPQVDFRQATLDHLPLTDNEFNLVVANASLIARERMRQVFAEMVRVAAAGATIALALPTASSFGEFFSIYWEALHNSELLDLEGGVENLITELPTISDMEQIAKDEGLIEVSSWSKIEEFDYDSGEEFLRSPLVSDFLMRDWLASVPDRVRSEVSDEISRIINEERHEANFALTVKATLVLGRKVRTQ
ncbi:MAG: class I SAM-dependent methyltransferase [Pyrinomonadaceae bacterium]